MSPEPSLSDSKDILSARMKEAPGDVFLQRLMQDVSKGEAREAICKQSQVAAEKNPDDGNLRYLAIRCLPLAAQNDAYRAALKRWPDNAWLIFANGYVEAEVANWPRAQTLLRQSLKSLPRMASVVAVDLVRIERMLNGTNPSDIQALSELSDRLRMVVSSEANSGVAKDPYRDLWAGRLDDAFDALPADPVAAGRLLYLLAASEGASDAIRTKARTVKPNVQFGPNAIIYGAARAAREGRDIAPYIALLDPNPQTFGPVRDFILKAKQKDIAGAEATLVDAPPELRGMLYAAGVVLLGQDAPASWRSGAMRLLFAAERPYFRQ